MKPIKFTSQSITQDKKRASVWYSMDNDNSIHILAENYGGFREIDFTEYQNLNYKDDSDSMSDYFCKPSLRIFPDHELYKLALAGLNKQNLGREKRKTKKENQRNKAKLEYSQLIEQNPEKYIIVKGIKFEIIEFSPHERLPGFTAYIMKKWNSKSQKVYYYALSADRKRATKLYSY